MSHSIPDVPDIGKAWWKSAWTMAAIFFGGVAMTAITDRITMATTTGADQVRLTLVETSIKELREGREEQRKIVSDLMMSVNLRLQHIEDILKQMSEKR